MSILREKRILLLILIVFLISGVSDYERAYRYLQDFDFLVKKCEANQVKLYSPQLFKKIKEYHRYATLAFKSRKFKTTIGYSIKGRELIEKALAIADMKAKKTVRAIVTNYYGDVKVKIGYTNKTVAAYNNMKLEKNDEVMVGLKSSVNLLFGNFGLIYLAPSAHLKLRNLVQDERYFTYSIVLELIEGEMRTKLNNFNFKESTFKIAVDEYMITARSKHFIIKTTRSSPTIVNFDGELLIYTGRDTITLMPNQGYGDKKVVSIAAPPALRYPRNIELRMRRTLFSWKKVEGAVRYRMQIATDAGFNQVVRNILTSREKEEIKELDDGGYFWRVRAIYANGAFTDWSATARFYVKQDTVPPALEIYTPYDGEVLNREYVYVSGRTEPMARVEINDISLTADTYGDFAKGLIMKEGLHIIKIRAYDKNDNITEKAIIVSIDYSPPPLVIKTKIPEYTSKEVLRIEGGTEEGATVRVNGETAAVEKGQFVINYILKEGGNKLVIETIDKAKNYSSRSFYIIRDSTPPPLQIEFPDISADMIPIFDNNVVDIKGKTEPHIRVLVNNDTIWTGATPDFSYKLFASEGINVVKITAIDSAANKTDTYVVFLIDTTKDKLVVSKDYIIFRKDTFDVHGFTYPNKTVFLNNQAFTADNNGRFRGRLKLIDGITKIRLKIR